MFNPIFLQAEGVTEAAQPNGMVNIIFIVAIIAVFYFFMIRPQKQQQKKIAEARNQMKTGDNVVTSGGLYGKVDGINTVTDAKGNTQVESFIIKLKPDYQVRIQVNKEAVFADYNEVAATQGK